jgi:hypothetical protein
MKGPWNARALKLKTRMAIFNGLALVVEMHGDVSLSTVDCIHSHQASITTDRVLVVAGRKPVALVRR